MRKNVDYAVVLETQVPKVAQAAKQADAELDRTIYEKEVRKAEETKQMTTRRDAFAASDTWWVAYAYDENIQYVPTNDKDHYVWNPRSVYFRTWEELQEVMERSKEEYGEISRWSAEAIPAHFGYYVVENKAGNYQAEVRDGRGFTVYKINEGLSLGEGETSLVQMDILNKDYEVDYLRLTRFLEDNRLPLGSKIYEGTKFDHICQEFREKRRKIEAEEDESPMI
jgi:hypothetical protein